MTTKRTHSLCANIETKLHAKYENTIQNLKALSGFYMVVQQLVLMCQGFRSIRPDYGALNWDMQNSNRRNKSY